MEISSKSTYAVRSDRPSSLYSPPHKQNSVYTYLIMFDAYSVMVATIQLIGHVVALTFTTNRTSTGGAVKT